MNHLWQSTLFAAAAGLLTLALKKNRAPVRYWLWFAASVKFLLPFSLLVTLGSRVEWRPAPAAARLVAAVPISAAIHEIGHPFAVPVPAPPGGPPILLGLWLCGVAVVVFGWTREWWRVRGMLRAASPLELNLPIRALSSPAGLEPGVFGVFRPVLLVPEGVTNRLTPAQWQAILAHELCHVRRRDNLTAAIHMLVEALFWFHPLVWWIGKRLVHERERACDEAVLLASGDPEAYAEGILNVCKFYLESPRVCMSGVTGSNLKKRVRAIMTQRISDKLNLGKKLLLAAAGIAAVVGPVVIGILHAPPLRAQSPPTIAAPPLASPAAAAPKASEPPVERATAPRILAQNQPRPAPAPAPATNDPGVGAAPADVETYVIGANDILSIAVFGQPTFTALYPVRPDGILTMRLIGDIKAGGLTPLQLQKQIAEALATGPLKDPEVTVTVYDVRSKLYTITGQVKKPGQYPLTRKTTVFEALTAAGSFLDNFSNKKDILILRGDKPPFHFNYTDYLKGGNRDQNITLEDGDTIVVK